VRLNKQGKPIVLRLWTRSQSDSSQSAGKLIAGWFDSLGLRIVLSVVDDGTLEDGVYATSNGAFKPNYDMFLWGWGLDPDPDFTLGVFTTAQINAWSDCAWSNPQYDKLFLEQETTIDPTARKAIVDKMQQIIYQQSPYIPTVYPKEVEAYNYAAWTGWVNTPTKGGGVFFTPPVMASYMSVHPASAATGGASHSKAVLIIGVVVGVVVVVVVVIVVLRRRRVAVEETT
jgi:peptide/nickel transport system substrate-binding protein